MIVIRQSRIFATAISVALLSVSVQAQQSTAEAAGWGASAPGTMAAGAIPPPPWCQGADLMVRTPTPPFHMNYGEGSYTEVTAAIDATAASVTTSTNLDDLESLLAFDALWIDVPHQIGQELMSPTELANISAFIDAGKRLVMIGDNQFWPNWNQQIVDLVGGDYIPGLFFGQASVATAHRLTAGVSAIEYLSASLVDGGTALFDPNVAALWDETAITMLDANILTNELLGSVDNDIYAGNLVRWIACVDSLTLSPPSGSFVATQNFDFALLVDAPDRSLTSGTVWLNDVDRTGYFRDCFVRGSHPPDGRTFRCPNLGLLLGPGVHTLKVEVGLSDGGLLEDEVTWEVLENTELGQPD